jgi:hypothetical protein
VAAWLSRHTPVNTMVFTHLASIALIPRGICTRCPAWSCCSCAALSQMNVLWPSSHRAVITG